MRTAMMVNFHFSERVLAFALSVLTAVPLCGQQSMVGAMPQQGEVVGNVSLGVGKALTLEEYLSPRPYSGFQYVVSNDRLSCHGTDRLFQYRRSHYSLQYSVMQDDNGSGSQMHAKLDAFYGWGHTIVSTQADDLMIGPAAMLSISGLYNRRNSNNPATADGYAALGFMADNTLRFRIAGYPMAFQATLYLPLAGIGYAPDYDQLYWIMYKNSQYGRTLHFVCPLNSPAFCQDLALSVPAGRNQVRVAFNVDYMSNRLGGKSTRLSHSSFMVGLTHRFERKYNGR